MTLNHWVQGSSPCGRTIFFAFATPFRTTVYTNFPHSFRPVRPSPLLSFFALFFERVRKHKSHIRPPLFQYTPRSDFVKRGSRNDAKSSLWSREITAKRRFSPLPGRPADHGGKGLAGTFLIATGRLGTALISIFYPRNDAGDVFVKIQQLSRARIQDNLKEFHKAKPRKSPPLLRQKPDDHKSKIFINYCRYGF